MVTKVQPPTVGTGRDKRIPSLDGIRGYALLTVLVVHIVLFRITAETAAYISVHHIGMVAVSTFLQLSGFLITLVLVREKQRSGSISLKNFYIRRAVRLWPALWGLVATTAVLGALGYVDVAPVNLASALLFVTNYLDQGADAVLGHTWTLSLEEQFYLVWPLVILAIGYKNLPRALAVAILAAPVVRVVSYFVLPGLRDTMIYQFHVRFDTLAMGCLLALVWHTDRVQKLLTKPWPIGAVAVLGLVVSLFGELLLGKKFMLVAGFSIQNIAIVAIIALTVFHHDTLFGRLFNFTLIKWLGIASYSMYLWQQMFLLTPWGVLQNWPVGLAATLIVGTLSYQLLEKPFMNLRNRKRKQAEGSVPLAADVAVDK
ncbi:acyltransferase [Rhodococcus sp. IEGM 1401]|uniref:acyltransferase family protein n=1 Tax=unclassified Rhodococcus (in: high G+C Gram-positive bacteria) TaxID=192944 RepID=UPI0022B3DE85|nr:MULTISPECIES: acyltransferase [unclassified Rhodococcus (in: high G+C Gram-positive bacteria)]MCZ4560885.1 acyltransferase [Rhodococcus sp. IEGM 1401]MDI9921026.1 acyltransferase [Rhodococcus sp. IEGM 1372]MDV8033374.1 acyltransferase [Rhodococcus sp. IEGM 1414]